jgi:hypothetical protein
MEHVTTRPKAFGMSEYDADLVLWSREQADLLRRMGAGERVNDQVDWENVAEEIESLGNSDRRDLGSRIQTVLRHLIKLAVSPADRPRAGWRRTVVEQRIQIRRLLKDSPSLRQLVSAAIADELADARALAQLDLSEFGEQPIASPSPLAFTEDEVLGPGFPDRSIPSC